MLYDVTVVPTERTAHVAIRMTNAVKRVVSVSFSASEAHFDFRGDGEVIRTEKELVWRPPPSEAVLRYKFRIDHLRRKLLR